MLNKEDYDTVQEKITTLAEENCRLIAEIARQDEEYVDQGCRLIDATRKVEAQRKVLEQALGALQTCRVWRFGGEEFKDYSVDEVEDVITAMQEALL